MANFFNTDIAENRQLLDKMADVVYVYAVLELASSIKLFRVGLIASCIICRVFTVKNKQA